MIAKLPKLVISPDVELVFVSGQVVDEYVVDTEAKDYIQDLEVLRIKELKLHKFCEKVKVLGDLRLEKELAVVVHSSHKEFAFIGEQGCVILRREDAVNPVEHKVVFSQSRPCLIDLETFVLLPFLLNTV